MDTVFIVELLLPLLFLAPLFLGLTIGAALPPFLYSKRKALAIILNVAGFLLYFLPALAISMLMSLDHIKDDPTLIDRLQALSITLGTFAAVELAVFLVRAHFAGKK